MAFSDRPFTQTRCDIMVANGDIVERITKRSRSFEMETQIIRFITLYLVVAGLFGDLTTTEKIPPSGIT